eukprot:2966691-Rhodomonas_salina.2
MARPTVRPEVPSAWTSHRVTRTDMPTPAFAPPCLVLTYALAMHCPEQTYALAVSCPCRGREGGRGGEEMEGGEGAGRGAVLA